MAKAKRTPEPAADPVITNDRATLARDAFVAKVMENRAKQDAPPPPPAPLTDRMRAQIEAEMARGAEVSRMHAEKQRIINQARADAAKEDAATEGYTTPVYRPPNFVLENKVGGK